MVRLNSTILGIPDSYIVLKFAPCESNLYIPVIKTKEDESDNDDEQNLEGENLNEARRKQLQQLKGDARHLQINATTTQVCMEEYSFFNLTFICVNM